MSAREFLRKPVYWESVILCVMCLADAFLTVLVVRGGRAIEANPLMAAFLHHSVAAFIFAKVASFVPGIVACEYLKFLNPSFAKWAIRLGVLGYAAVYLFGELKVNGLF